MTAEAPITSGRALSAPHRRWVYATAGTLWLSGLGWILACRVFRPDGLDPELPGPSEVLWLRAHGIAATLFLVILGTLLPIHVGRRIRFPTNRGSGITLLMIFAVLTLSGDGLYYLTAEDWRAATSVLHWSLGLAVPLVIGWHVTFIRGHRRRRSR
jgi:hypothetical protein